jgi:hypothetical protein
VTPGILSPAARRVNRGPNLSKIAGLRLESGVATLPPIKPAHGPRGQKVSSVMNRRLNGFVILILAVAGLAQAQSYTPETMRAQHWEFAVQTRYAWSNTYNTEGGSSIEVDDDLGWGFGMGYNLSQQFNLGFAFSWRSTPYTAKIVPVSDPLPRYYNNWLDTSTAAVTGDFNLLKGRITPYVSGSVGWLGINSNIAAGTDVGCYWDPWYGYLCVPYTSTYGADCATWGLGIGLRAEITPTMFMRAGWDHNWNDLDTVDGVDLMRIDIGAIF